jgi:hypothetical protein
MYLQVPILAIFLFILKHLVCDFFLQPPYMFLNKGKLLHPGGLLHSLVNGVGTTIVIAIVFPQVTTPACLMFGALEMIAHYAIDFSRVNLQTIHEWRPESSPNYWFLLGIDQTLHHLYYLLLMYLIANKVLAVGPDLVFPFALTLVIGIAMAGFSSLNKS